MHPKCVCSRALTNGVQITVLFSLLAVTKGPLCCNKVDERWLSAQLGPLHGNCWHEASLTGSQNYENLKSNSTEDTSLKNDQFDNIQRGSMSASLASSVICLEATQQSVTNRTGGSRQC